LLEKLMSRAPKIFSLRALAILVVGTLSIALASFSNAAIIANWDYETINGLAATDGQTLTANDLNTFGDGDHITDGSGNGNDLANYFNGGYGVYQNIGTNATLAGHKTGNYDGTWTDGDLELNGNPVGALATWDISADVYFLDAGGWQTIVGKDGYQVGGTGAANPGDPLAAALYVQKNGIDSKFRVNFADTAGNRWVLDGTTVAVANTWYNVRATSDGSTLRIYVDGSEENSLDISASADSSLVALQTGEVEGSSGPPYAWSVARGMYNDGHGDRVNGYVDNVIIKGTPVPEPTSLSLALFSLFGLAGLARRR
jgi:hypothetical protein